MKTTVDKQMKLNNDSETAQSHKELNSILVKDYTLKLRESNLFTQDDSKSWVITRDNLNDVLSVIQVNSKSIQIKPELILNDKDSLAYEEFIEQVASLVTEGQASKKHDYTTPAQAIIDMLKTIQNDYLKNDEQSISMRKKILYAIEKISDKQLFKVDCAKNLQAPIRRRGSMHAEWLGEFSTINQDLLWGSTLKNSLMLNKPPQKNPPSSFDAQMSQTLSFQTIQEFIGDNQDAFQGADQRTFDLFSFIDKVGRRQSFSVLSHHMLQQSGALQTKNINEEKLTRFLGKIYSGYRRDVQYHNDLHGLDVMQMTYSIISQGNLVDVTRLNSLDLLSMLIGSVCHDFDHDGFNNSFHVNAMTKRAILYSDQCVQENWHVAQSFKIMLMSKYNFLEDSPSSDLKTFRKRMIGMILATDMARHVNDLASFKAIVEQKEIKQGKNVEKLIDTNDDAKVFQQQQQLLEMVVHSADVSSQTRSFETAKKWTYLLFEEFFDQGDLEKERGLPVSFLCDRQTTNICKSQPGFINFIVKPLFSTLSEIMPCLNVMVEQVTENCKTWESYQETELDLESYNKKKVYKTPQEIRDEEMEDLDENCCLEPVKLN